MGELIGRFAADFRVFFAYALGNVGEDAANGIVGAKPGLAQSD